MTPQRQPLRQFRTLQLARGRVRWALLVLLVLALLGGAGTWWWQRPAGGEAGTPGAAGRKPGRMGGGGQAQPVSAGEVQRRDLREQISAIGTMNARATAVVRARVSGELLALHFREGDEVRAGQLLAEIDPRSYQAALDQAQGNLQRDQALLHNARIDLQRYQGLLAQDSIASQQVDTQAALVRQLEGTVVADKAQVDSARLQWGYTRIVAPFAGRLGIRLADRGNLVGPTDANGIVAINQVRPIDAVFSVPEVYVAQINQRLADGERLPVELWDREFKRLVARGHLTALDNAIDVATGTIKAKAAFANDDGALFPNQFVNVRLQIQQHKDLLTVPVSAVQNNAVYLVQADGTVTQRRVRVGVVDGDRVGITADLKEGDQVVTDGLDRLREGARVSVIDTAANAAKADEAAQDAAGRRAALLRSLSPQERDKLAAMSPEERRAFFRARRAQPQGAGEPAASVPASR